MSQFEQLRIISWNECLQHITKQSCWLVIHSVVYDVTKFLSEHPGGEKILLQWAGSDASKKFDEIGHSEYAKSIMTAKAIGKIQAQINQTYSQILKTKKEQKVSNVSVRADKQWSWQQIQRNNVDQTLLVIDNKVYNVSSFLNQHPGGPLALKKNGAKDATEQFNSVGHSEKAKQLKEQFCVGHLRAEQRVKPVQKWWRKGQFMIAGAIAGVFAGWYFTKKIIPPKPSLG